MIETKDITKMVSHILRRDKGIADTELMHPVREWFIGLGLTSLAVALGSWFCFYLYLSYSAEMQKEVVVVEQAVPYQATAVKNALELFAFKQKKFSEIIGGGSTSGVLLPAEPATSTPKVMVIEPEGAVPELRIDPPPLPDEAVVIPATLAP